jgi:hypothetical protein
MHERSDLEMPEPQPKWEDLYHVQSQLRAAEERVKHYRFAALHLCGGDKAKLKEALRKTEDKFQ